MWIDEQSFVMLPVFCTESLLSLGILGRALIDRLLHGESILSFENSMMTAISNVLGNLEHFFP